MKTLLITMLLFTFACGKNNSGGQKCLSRWQKVTQCYQQYNETHDQYYVERICGEKYPEEGCYK